MWVPICCTVFPGPVTGLLDRAAFFVIWAFRNRVSNLCFVSGCLFSRLKPLLRQGSLVLTPAGLRTSRHFGEQVTRSLVPVGPHLFLCPPGVRTSDP